MASFADGIGRGMDGLIKLAGCGCFVGVAGVVFGICALIWR